MLSPLSTVILAALLTPADFGTVAISTMVIALARIVVGLGLSPAVIQRRSRAAEAATVAFWTSLSVTTVLYGLLWIAAPWIAQAYQIPPVASVIRVSGVSLFLFSLESIPRALLQRGLRFRSLFWVDSLPQVASILVSVILALLGGGVWALVFGPLAGATLRVPLVWLLAGWRPLPRLDGSVVRPLLGFSAWTLGASIQTWLFLQADNAIAGYFLGDEGLGIYSLGFSFGNLFPGLVIPALSAVAYPAFCALQEHRADVVQNLLKLQSLAAVLLLPVAFGLSAVAVPAVGLLYGDKWNGLGEVIALMAIMPGLSHLWSLNADAYRAIGRPDVWPKLSGVTLLILIPSLFLVGPYGLIPFTVTRFGVHFVYPLLNVMVGTRVLGVSGKDQAKALAVPLVCVSIMYVVMRLLVNALVPFAGAIGWAKLFLVSAVGALVYSLLLWRTNKDLWHRTLLAGRQALLGVR